MIPVKKTKPAPVSLQNSHKDMKVQIRNASSQGKNVFLATKGTKAAKSTSGNPNDIKIIIDDDQYKPADAKAILKLDHYGKCAFCEARFMDTAGGDVEHFRPKKRYDEYVPPSQPVAAEKNFGYFQYVYDWDNHLWSCKECNEAYKKNYFDLMPDMSTPPPNEENFSDTNQFQLAVAQWGSYQKSVHDKWDSQQKEAAILINPTKENPRGHINFDSRTGMAVGARLDDYNDVLEVSHRGGKNILVLGLNRPELVFSRARHLTMLRGVFVEMQQDFDQTIKFLRWQRGDKWQNTLKSRTLREQVDYPIEISVNKANLTYLEFLMYSTTPQAPFSALAMDALAVWSLELAAHISQQQQHIVQLQSPNMQVIAQTRSIHNLLPLSIVNNMRNQYNQDKKVIAKLKSNASIYSNPLRPIEKSSEICFICRDQLHKLIARQKTLAQHHAQRYTNEYIQEFDGLYREIGSVEKGLEQYSCKTKDWKAAVKTLDTNMQELAPDLVFDLIANANQQFINCKNLYDWGKTKPLDQQWQTLLSQTNNKLSLIEQEISKRSNAIDDDQTKQTASSMIENITVAKQAIQTMANKQLPQTLPKTLTPEPIPKISEVKATKVTNVPKDSDKMWHQVLKPKVSNDDSMNVVLTDDVMMM